MKRVPCWWISEENRGGFQPIFDAVTGENDVDGREDEDVHIDFAISAAFDTMLDIETCTENIYYFVLVWLHHLYASISLVHAARLKQSTNHHSYDT